MTAFLLEVSGSLFVAAAVMPWLGWMLLRVRPAGFLGLVMVRAGLGASG